MTEFNRYSFETESVQKERIQTLNGLPVRDGKYVLYWMQASPRTEYNHALEYAVEKANKLNRPLLAFFGVTDKFPDANERTYWFMLEGLLKTRESLAKRGIQLVIWLKSPEQGAVLLSKNASLMVVDKGYLKIQKEWYDYVAKRTGCALVQVETNVVVPVEAASLKEEYSAATFRPKLRKILERYLHPLREEELKLQSLDFKLDSVDTTNLEQLLEKLSIDRTVSRVKTFQGGTEEAKTLLEAFIKHKLNRYPDLKNDPSRNGLSDMSPYLHFGQISPLQIALEVVDTDSQGKDAFLEELIVRRELAMNFVFYNEEYSSFHCLPQWAKKTLHKHQSDRRAYQYGFEELERGQTHDPAWNAAQKEMVLTGKMHGYLRMYWGKKLIEWTESPEDAFRIALYLNNKYELDGRDPNGFAGIAWCFGKHDRPWKERPIFGIVRYMSETGLKRKFDVNKYIQKINSL